MRELYLKRNARLMSTGVTLHFGLRTQIVRQVHQGITTASPVFVALHVNVDGIPVFRSSATNFWPILQQLGNAVDKSPFLVSLFCGIAKPEHIEKFVAPFVHDMKDLEQGGILHHGRVLPVVLSAGICDVPARAFVKCCGAYHRLRPPR